MEKIYFDEINKIRKNREELEKSLNIKILIAGKKVEIEGSPIEEYEASLVLKAMAFGFSKKIALTLKNEDVTFRVIPIKMYTRRKNIKDVKGRLIGTGGKTKRTIEEISGCDLVVHKNEVGIIGPSESIDNITTAITSIIKGTKQANAYAFLERMNRLKHYTDLGLKEKKQNKKHYNNNSNF